MIIDATSLYRIGTGWVFDINTYIGYRVERAGAARRNKVEAFKKAFTINIDNVEYDISYDLEVPMGVVRKAIHLIQLSLTGELEARRGKYR